MLLARSLLFYPLFFGSTLFFSLLLVIFGWALPYAQRCRIAVAWGAFNLWVLRVVCGLSYRVLGLENLPVGNAVLLVKPAPIEGTALIALERVETLRRAGYSPAFIERAQGFLKPSFDQHVVDIACRLDRGLPLPARRVDAVAVHPGRRP